jgi:hypothetical protein
MNQVANRRRDSPLPAISESRFRLADPLPIEFCFSSILAFAIRREFFSQQ